MTLKSVLTYVGKNVKPYWPTVSVASAELIFRPLFTMMDKKTPDETKKYTALREAITELIAAPTYLVLPILAAKGSDLLRIKDLEKQTRAKHNLQTLGTWTAALVVIPGLCTAIVKPFMNKIYANKKQSEGLDITSEAPEVKQPALSVQIPQTGNVSKPALANRVTFSDFRNSGMKVG